jgi:hypothetical protein
VRQKKKERDDSRTFVTFVCFVVRIVLYAPLRFFNSSINCGTTLNRPTTTTELRLLGDDFTVLPNINGGSVHARRFARDLGGAAERSPDRNREFRRDDFLNVSIHDRCTNRRGLYPNYHTLSSLRPKAGKRSGNSSNSARTDAIRRGREPCDLLAAHEWRYAEAQAEAMKDGDKRFQFGNRKLSNASGRT